VAVEAPARRAGALAAIGVVVLLALTGCGSGGGTADTPAQQVRLVANQFSAAFGSGNIKKACALWDPAVWAGPDPQRFGCVGIYGGGSSAFERSFLTAKVERVVVNGDIAKVGFSNEQIVEFKKVGDRWMVENLGGEGNTTSLP
jgi:hypothetical protein